MTMQFSSMVLYGIMGCSVGLIPNGRGILGQCMGSESIQHREEIGQILIFSGSPNVES